MKNWPIFGCLVAAFLVVPVCVNWLRHRPHRLTEPTQHIVLAGIWVQFLLVGLSWLLGWLF